QMKVGKHRAHQPELITRINKIVSIAGARQNLAFAFLRCVFQSPYSSSTHGNNATPITNRAVDPAGGFITYKVSLRMQPVFFHPLDPDGLKSSKSHMQCDLCGHDAASPDLRQNLGREMQPRGG